STMKHQRWRQLALARRGFLKLVFAPSPFRPQRGAYVTDFVSPEELKQMRESRAQFILIDVRRQIDFDADPAVIPGAIRRAPESVESWVSSIPPGRPIIVYCVRGGSVSKSVTPALCERGHDARYI